MSSEIHQQPLLEREKREQAFFTDFHFVTSPGQRRELAQQYFSNYLRYEDKITWRKLAESGYPVWRSYDEELPYFHDQSFIALVDAEITRRQQVAGPGNPITPVKILDIGFGRGEALLDMHKRWGKAVELFGYGDLSHAKELRHSSKTGRIEALPTIDRLEKAPITIVEGNAIDLRRNLQQKFGDDFSLDFITACHVFQYVEYPTWEMLKKIYRLLTPKSIDHEGGIFLANEFVPPGDWDTGEIVFKKLLRRGYDVNYNYGSTAIQRTLPELPSNIRSIQAVDMEEVVPHLVKEVDLTSRKK